jgi:hypothetical protein
MVYSAFEAQPPRAPGSARGYLLGDRLQLLQRFQRDLSFELGTIGKIIAVLGTLPLDYEF